MRINFGKLFQEKSKDRKMDGLVRIPEDSANWPADWKVVRYKTYERFTETVLPKPIPKEFGHKELLKRFSLRDFDYVKNNNSFLNLEHLSNILYYSCGETKKSLNNKENKRIYPSAGARYPIEVYIMSFSDKKCFHYNVKNHSLESLWDAPLDSKKDINKYFAYEWSQNAAYSIILTGIPERLCTKYGERGYRYMYLEAGAILNNLQNNAMLEGYKSVIMGGINESEIENLFDLDGVQETVILGILLGK